MILRCALKYCKQFSFWRGLHRAQKESSSRWQALMIKAYILGTLQRGTTPVQPGPSLLTTDSQPASQLNARQRTALFLKSGLSSLAALSNCWPLALVTPKPPRTGPVHSLFFMNRYNVCFLISSFYSLVKLCITIKHIFESFLLTGLWLMLLETPAPRERNVQTNFLSSQGKAR